MTVFMNGGFLPSSPQRTPLNNPFILSYLSQSADRVESLRVKTAGLCPPGLERRNRPSPTEKKRKPD